MVLAGRIFAREHAAPAGDFDGLRSRQGQAQAILVAYDVMEVDGEDMRPEPLEERRKRLARLLSRSNKAMRQGIQLSEAITGDGPPSFATPAVWALIGPTRRTPGQKKPPPLIRKRRGSQRASSQPP